MGPNELHQPFGGSFPNETDTTVSSGEHVRSRAVPFRLSPPSRFEIRGETLFNLPPVGLILV